MVKKRKTKLPQEIILFESEDKLNHERWGDKNHKGNDLANFPTPFVMVISGGKNRGKSTIIKNILLHINPPFEEIYLYHFDEDTKEYNKIKHTKLEYIPTVEDEFIKTDIKKLLILEDWNISNMTKKQKEDLDRCLGYLNSHCNLSIIISSQNLNSIPPQIRRMTNIFIIFPSMDRDFNTYISKKIGYQKGFINSFIDTYVKGKHDSILIDLSPNSPAEIRLNVFKKINLKK